MNDRYLFRGKALRDTDLFTRGEWVQGQAHLTEDTACIILGVAYTPGGGFNADAVLVNPATVGQCTGLRDRNGQLIYEGDIVKVTQPSWPKVEIAHIQYRTENACFASWRRWRDYKENSQETPRILGNYGLRSNEEYEVVGNIHDNPELLAL